MVVEEPKPEPVKINNRDVESMIPRVQEVRDKLIRFRADLENQGV